MEAEQSRKIEEIYHAALEIDERKRESFLTDICGEDVNLRQEIQSLLGFAEISSSLLDLPPTDVAAEMLSQSSNSPFIGKKVGHYKIDSLIGLGGMGEVFLAHDTKLGRKAAIKFIKTEFVKDKDRLRRFLQEAKTASSLNHPNILTIYEIGESKNRNFIAAEFIEGKTLRKAINEGNLSLNQILEIAVQVGTALNAAHCAGIIHRDIKPENIMLRDDGLVKVLDFGLAKLTEERHGDTGTRGHGEKNKTQITPSPHHPVSASQQTNPSLLMGTAAYISPEQARFKPVDGRSDVWSLSVVLFELLNGCQPFKGNTSAEIIDSVLNSEPDSFAENLPDELKLILRKGLQKKADNRYQTAAELLVDLKDFQQNISLTTDFKKNAADFKGNGITNPNKSRVSASVLGNTDGRLEIESKGFSSGELIFRRLRKNRTFSIGTLAVLFIAFGLIGYFYFAERQPNAASMVVIPLTITVEDSNIEHIADGISQSLINSLSQIDGMKVIAQDSAFKFKGKEAEFEKTARNFGVQYVLQGQIKQIGENLQISVELIDARNNSQIWNRQFNRKLTEISDVDIEISRQIAEKLQLNSVAGQLLTKTTKLNPQAYELLLKGRYFHSKSSFATSIKAIEYYNQALAIDPNFAQAYAALANAYLYIGQNGFQEPKEMLSNAKTAAEKALEFDDTLPQAHLAMAGIKRVDWDWSGAEKEYQRAIELNPHLARNHFNYAIHLSTLGKHEQAISEMKLARELDPLKPNINDDLAYIYFFARKFDTAFEQYKIAEELDPNFGPTYYGKGFVYAVRGQYSEAIDNYNEMIRLSGNHTGVDCYLGFALAKAGRTNEAREILKKLENGKDYVSPVELAILYLGFDEPEKAISALERGFNEHDSQLQYLGIEPHFDSLHSDQRFQDLLKRVGLYSSSLKF